MRNVRLVDNITKFYYKIVECCLVFKKFFEKITSILQFSTFEKNCLNVMNYISKKKCFQFEKLIYFLDLTLFIAIKPSKNLGIFFWNVFKHCTTIYKAGLSKV